MKKKREKQRFIILTFLIGILVLGIVAVQTPQTLFSKAAYPKMVTIIPTPTIKIFVYLPKPGYAIQPKNCITTGCKQPLNECFISCRDGVFGCQEYLKKNSVNTNYSNGQYLCQNYWVLPSPYPTWTPVPIPTKVILPTPTPEPYEKIITKYSTWIGKNNLTDCIRNERCGPILDLTSAQADELHAFFDNDTTDAQIKKYVFSVTNDSYNWMETDYFTQNINGQNIKTPFNNYYIYNIKNDFGLDVSLERHEYKLDEATFNPLYKWNIYGYGIVPEFAWPHIFGVDESKSFVFYAPETSYKIGAGYPVEPGIPDSQKGKIQKAPFSTYQNKIFISIPTSSSPYFLWEIYKNTEGNILFRGIWLRDITLFK